MTNESDNENGMGNDSRPLAETELDIRRLRRQHVEEVVRQLGPDAAWLRLGVSRATLYRWLRRWREEDARARMATRGDLQ